MGELFPAVQELVGLVITVFVIVLFVIAGASSISADRRRAEQIDGEISRRLFEDEAAPATATADIPPPATRKQRLIAWCDACRPPDADK